MKVAAIVPRFSCAVWFGNCAKKQRLRRETEPCRKMMRPIYIFFLCLRQCFLTIFGSS
jgi:hypothetical protein